MAACGESGLGRIHRSSLTALQGGTYAVFYCPCVSVSRYLILVQVIDVYVAGDCLVRPVGSYRLVYSSIQDYCTYPAWYVP